MADILIIKLSALGDLVQADGAIRDIRNFHSNDRLHAILPHLHGALSLGG